MGGWVVVISGVLLLVLSVMGHAYYQAANRFEADGRPATAIVQDRYTTQSRNSDGDSVTKRWLVLEFTTRRGQAISIRRTVSTREFGRALKGEPFDLVYLEGRPDRVELTPGQNRLAARVQQWIALVLGVVWLGSLRVVGGWAVAAVRARRFGARCVALVTDIRRTNIRINKDLRYRLVWQDETGRHGTSLLHRDSELAHLKPGDRIEVYQGLRRGWWVGDVGHRAG